MTDLTKPSEKPQWATDVGAAIVTPALIKQQQGWIVEAPPHQFFNWLHRKTYDWINYFEAKGDTDLGGYAESSLTIASGSITPTIACHSIDTEGGAASDDLTNILTTNLQDGRLLLIRSVSAARVITIKHNAGGAGQIALTAGIDLVLADPTEFLLLKRTGANWEQVFTSQVGSDITPFLGGNLDVKTRKIYTSTTDGDIVIEPNGTGALVPETTGKALGSTSKKWAVIASTITAATGVYANTIDTPNASETLNIGNTNALTINIGRVGATIAFYGSVTEVHTTNTYVSDKIITLNDGGLAGSGSGVGFEVEENALITGYIKTSANRNKWSFLCPGDTEIISIGTEAVDVGDIAIVSNALHTKFTGYNFKNSSGTDIMVATDAGAFSFGTTSGTPVGGQSVEHTFKSKNRTVFRLECPYTAEATHFVGQYDIVTTGGSYGGITYWTIGFSTGSLLGSAGDLLIRNENLTAASISALGVCTFGTTTGTPSAGGSVQHIFKSKNRTILTLECPYTATTTHFVGEYNITTTGGNYGGVSFWSIGFGTGTLIGTAGDLVIRNSNINASFTSAAGAWNFPINTTHNFGEVATASDTIVQINAAATHKSAINLLSGTGNVQIQSLAGVLKIGDGTTADKYANCTTGSNWTFGLAATTGQHLINGTKHATYRHVLGVKDNTADAVGVGGGILFYGIYSGVAYEAASVEAYKESTGTNSYGTSICFNTASQTTGTMAQRMILTSSSYLGIGTTNPKSRLHIRTTSAAESGLFIQNTSSGTFALDVTGTAGSSVINFRCGGGVGNGTTDLTTYGTIKLEGSNIGSWSIGATSGTDTAEHVINVNTAGFGLNINQRSSGSNGLLFSHTGTQYGAINFTSGSEFSIRGSTSTPILVVDNNGRMTIGKSGAANQDLEFANINTSNPSVSIQGYITAVINGTVRYIPYYS